MEYGSESSVKEAGKLMIQGKEYVVNDGDVMHFRFNVQIIKFYLIRCCFMFRLRLLIILILTANFCFLNKHLHPILFLTTIVRLEILLLEDTQIGVFDSKDASTAIFLPSNLLLSHDNSLVINYNNHFADSDFGMVNYNFKLREKGSCFFLPLCFIITTEILVLLYSIVYFLGNSLLLIDISIRLNFKKLNDIIQIGFNFKISSCF